MNIDKGWSGLGISLAIGCCSVLFPLAVWSLDDKDGTGNDYNQFNPYGNAYVGDLHVHMTLSVDIFFPRRQNHSRAGLSICEG